MFSFLRNDLRKYKQVYQKSIEQETIYSPLTPTHQYSKSQLEALPKTATGIVDLSSVMDEYKEPFKAYEKHINDLKTDIHSLKQESQQANNEKEDYERQYKKIKE